MSTVDTSDWTRAFSQRALNQGDTELATILAGSPPGVLSVTGGFPSPTTFPTDVLNEIVARLLRDDPGVALQYAPSEGIPSVREYLIDRQEHLQGRRPEKDELIVTSGGMECITLAGLALLDPGDTVVVEAPTYLGALMAFAGFEAPRHRHPDGRARPPGRRARGAPRRRPAPEADLPHPRLPEPDRAHAHARAAPGADRAVPAPRHPDPRGRRLPRDVLRRQRAAVAVVARRPTSSCRSARSRRSSAPASGSAGRSGRRT